jgi:hypothetical protein
MTTLSRRNKRHRNGDKVLKPPAPKFRGLAWIVGIFIIHFLMKVKLFESFTKSLDRLPAKKILKTIETEGQMLRDDLLQRRVEEQDLATISSFCEFVKAASVGEVNSPVELPPNYRMDCRRIILRLIEAGELPSTAQEQFNLTFPVRLSKNHQ